MANNKRGKKGASIGLANEQYYNLNKMFYKKYMNNFFFIKLENLLYIISRTSEYKDMTCNKTVEIGLSKTNIEEHEDKELVQYAKTEIVSTYFHCIETFIRLFIAHASLAPCPWIAISDLKIHEYKDALDKLSKGDFTWLNKKYSENITILYVFFGFEEMPKDLNNVDIEGLKKWIKWAANELLNNYEYNSFKHGMSIYTESNGFTLENDLGDRIGRHGDCIEILAKTENKDRFIWNRQISFIEYDSKSAIIWTVANLIKDILFIGGYQLAELEYERGWIPNYKWNIEFLNQSIEKLPDLDMDFYIRGFNIGLIYNE